MIRIPRSFLFICTFALFVTSFSPAYAETCYRIGAWNLENFKKGKERGFPEMSGLRPRTTADVRKIARAIENRIKAKILVLNEINGRKRGSRPLRSSDELESLTNMLGSSWKYIISKTGNNLRIAIIWDSNFARLNSPYEIYIARKLVADRKSPGAQPSEKDFFARDPLVGHFTLLEGGKPRNDLTVVGLHLASSQWRIRNHDQAMDRLRGEMRALRGKNRAFPKNEDDILIAGDLNASMFNRYNDRFFQSYNKGNWKVLARDGYPGTRINGSTIDYVIVTQRNSRQKGLFGQEIVGNSAKVHRELANGDMRKYREVYSDHFPVTTCVRVMDDSD